ncbi:hypothetical protein [Aeromicrobium sp. NPDC092404]|uniref:hypothetical protein n=1 Tax=Aeromicrobium sp. NPDC092404 TaxID=3154976 RepID=UPI00343BE35C
MTDIKQSVATQLEIDPDDLEPVEDDTTTHTFRQSSTGRLIVARVEVGPEGPVVEVADPA